MNALAKFTHNFKNIKQFKKKKEKKERKKTLLCLQH